MVATVVAPFGTLPAQIAVTVAVFHRAAVVVACPAIVLNVAAFISSAVVAAVALSATSASAMMAVTVVAVRIVGITVVRSCLAARRRVVVDVVDKRHRAYAYKPEQRQADNKLFHLHTFPIGCNIVVSTAKIAVKRVFVGNILVI